MITRLYKMKPYLNVVLLFTLVLLGNCVGREFEAEDCVLYEGKVSSKSRYRRRMHHQLSTGVLQRGDQFAATLSLTSLVTREKCDVSIHTNIVTVSCPRGMKLYNWSPEMFKKQDVTELWVHVGALGDRNKEAGQKDISTDLAVIGRRGSHRGHILFPSSGLQPPIFFRWKPAQPMDYYFNCVTGCLYTKNAVTDSGAHTFFFRPGLDFEELYITYNSTEHRAIQGVSSFHELYLNGSDIEPDGQWKKITVVWDNEGGIGVLVGTHPLRGLESFSKLKDKRGIEASVVGGGLIRLCDKRFKNVANARMRSDSLNYTTTATSADLKDASGYESSKDWLMIVAVACIIALLITAVILIILLMKTKRKLQSERVVSSRNYIPCSNLNANRTATTRSTAPLNPVDSPPNSRNSKDASMGLTGPALTPNSNTYSLNGPKT